MQGGYLNTIFALILAVALVGVFWSLAMYYAEINSEAGKREYKGLIIGTITALFLLMCLFAVIEWIRGAFGI